jgi:hypothetical protein
MNSLARCLILFLLAPTLQAQASAAAKKSQVVTYPFPEDLAASERFHVLETGVHVSVEISELPWDAARSCER